MAEITDFFGKASIDSDYAIATTVKTTRVAGVTVLEAFDLSKFSDDTPVFFITYKKTTDPVTSDVSVVDLVSWKGLVNVGANTLTNLTLAPGYEDRGNDIGDFVECIPTSYWVNELITGLSKSMNPDGTLKAVTNSPGWTGLTAGVVGAVTNNGNRSHTCVFNGVDLTETLSPGMRLRFDRTVNAQTQVADFEASSTQYASKTSPTGITFTDDFTCEAWVKLESYKNGIITSRGDASASNGWIFDLDPTGIVALQGRSGGAYRRVKAYQSLPLNRWVHIAASIDLSANTGTIYLDGVSVPAVMDGAATGVAQTGELLVGARATPADFFDGKLSDVRVWSTIRTATQIKENMNQYPSDTTGLVAHFKLDGNFNDSSSNANNLTASGGATATNTDSPFSDGENAANGFDFGIVMAKPTFSGGNTTVVVQTAEANAIPTSGGVASVAYSSQAVPFGFPKAKSRWALQSIYLAVQNLPQNTGVWYSGTVTGQLSLDVPAGEWHGYYAGAMYSDIGAAANMRHGAALSTSDASPVDLMWRAYSQAANLGQNALFTSDHSRSGDISINSMTKHYLLARTDGGAGNFQWSTAGYPTQIRVDNAYL